MANSTRTKNLRTAAKPSGRAKTPVPLPPRLSKAERLVRRADQQVRNAERFAAESQRAKRLAGAKYALATRRAYMADWSEFEAWCASRKVASLPALPQTVATFLAFESERGLKTSSIGRRAAAIRYAHSKAGFDSPTTTEVVSATVRGIRRTRGTAPLQKEPATRDRLLEMLEYIPAGIAGYRDRALLLIGFAGAFRRSELVAITVEDLQFVRQGVRVTVPKSKTDQERRGVVVPILRGKTACPVTALREWLDRSKIKSGPVFRRIFKNGRVGPAGLAPYTVAQLVKRYAGLAGFDADDFSGHSLRAGFATSAVAKGASLFRVMDITRHKSTDTLRGYVRRAEEFEEHAAEDLL